MKAEVNGWVRGGRRVSLRPRLLHPSGHTLPELLIVLTILVLFALIAFPRMAQSLTRTRLDAAFEAVRSDLSFAKARAISTGMRHQVLVDTESRELLVAPVRMSEMAETGGVPADPTATAPPALRDNLSEEIQVAEWSVSPLGMAQENARAAVQTGTPLVFYPEGQSDSARVVLEDSSGARRGLLVDAFTGEIRELSPEELER
jgi:prepilin-type N-terminal cleavage/methylation domain-containing protein